MYNPISIRRDITPSQPFHIPVKRIEFYSLPDRSRTLQPLDELGRVPKDSAGLYLALLENLFFPHLGPGLWGMAEHRRVKFLKLTFHWHAGLRTEDDGARTRVKQCCQTFAEFELFLFVEEVKDSGSADDRDVAS